MFLALINIVLIGLTQPSASSLQTGCPSDDPRMREVVERFQSRPAYAQDRSTLGTASIPLDQITVLDGRLDAMSCKRFVGLFGASEAHPRWRWVAYRVGSHYFVAFRHIQQAGKQRMGHSPLFVYDSAYNQVGAFAM